MGSDLVFWFLGGFDAAYCQPSGLQETSKPNPTPFFRPLRYKSRRWQDAASLETLARERATFDGRHEFPPQKVGTVAMDWGIYNDTYGEPWAITYPGQVWLRAAFKGWQTVKLSERDARLSPEPPENNTLEEAHWISLKQLTGWLGNVFRFAASVANEFPDTERVEWSLTGQDLDRMWLSTGRGSSPFDFLGPSRSPGLSRSQQLSSAAFREQWIDHCADAAKELCDFFSRDGRYVGRESLKHALGQTNQHA